MTRDDILALAREAGIPAFAPSSTQLNWVELARFADLVVAQTARQCTCPSGDGSLRWPCPVHPQVMDAATAPAPRQHVTDGDIERIAYRHTGRPIDSQHLALIVKVVRSVEQMQEGGAA